MLDIAYLIYSIGIWERVMNLCFVVLVTKIRLIANIMVLGRITYFFALFSNEFYSKWTSLDPENPKLVSLYGRLPIRTKDFKVQS